MWSDKAPHQLKRAHEQRQQNLAPKTTSIFNCVKQLRGHTQWELNLSLTATNVLFWWESFGFHREKPCQSTNGVLAKWQPCQKVKISLRPFSFSPRRSISCAFESAISRHSLHLNLWFWPELAKNRCVPDMGHLSGAFSTICRSWTGSHFFLFFDKIAGRQRCIYSKADVFKGRFVLHSEDVSALRDQAESWLPPDAGFEETQTPHPSTSFVPVSNFYLHLIGAGSSAGTLFQPKVSSECHQRTTSTHWFLCCGWNTCVVKFTYLKYFCRQLFGFLWRREFFLDIVHGLFGVRLQNTERDRCQKTCHENRIANLNTSTLRLFCECAVWPGMVESHLPREMFGIQTRDPRREWGICDPEVGVLGVLGRKVSPQPVWGGGGGLQLITTTTLDSIVPPWVLKPRPQTGHKLNLLVLMGPEAQARIQDFGQGGPEPKICLK